MEMGNSNHDKKRKYSHNIKTETNIQKQALPEVEDETRELNERKSIYHYISIIEDEVHNQLIEDLNIVHMRIAARGKNCIEGSRNNELTNNVKEGRALRWISTTELSKVITDTIDDQVKRSNDTVQIYRGNLSSEDMLIEISKINEMEKKSIDKLRKVVDILHGKHEEHTVDECLRDQSVICTPLVTDNTPQSPAIDSSPNTSHPKRIRKPSIKLKDFVLYK